MQNFTDWVRYGSLPTFDSTGSGKFAGLRVRSSSDNSYRRNLRSAENHAGGNLPDPRGTLRELRLDADNIRCPARSMRSLFVTPYTVASRI